MPAPFKLAIIGCGKIAATHAEAALLSPLAEITALVDPSPGRAEALAERFRITPRIALDVNDVAKSIDGAIIATPNHTHVDLAERCLAAGLPVLIEKPLALTADEGVRICDASQRSGAIVAVGYFSRFRKNVQLMKRLLEEEHFGRIHRFAYQVGTRGGWSPMSAYNLDRRTSGGGVLVTTGTHFVDRMLYWFGYPDEAELQDDSAGGPEANAVARFAYKRGSTFVGVTRFSKTVALPAGFVMETELGTVLLKEGANARILVRPTDKPHLEYALAERGAPPPADDEFVRQLEDFIHAARDGYRPAVTAEQGLDSLRLLDHLYRHRRAALGDRPAQGMVLPA